MDKIIVSGTKYYFWHWIWALWLTPPKIIVMEWEFSVSDDYKIEKEFTGAIFKVPIYLWIWIRFLGILYGSRYERVRVFAANKYKKIRVKYEYPIDFIGTSVYKYMPIMDNDLDEYL